MNKEVKIISDLMEACKSLMDEISQWRATNWGVVNDAMQNGQRYIVAHTKKDKDQS